MEATYIKSAAEAHQLPEYLGPEIAVFGRSNVGKSSLLNVLMSRRGLARESREPGRTRMVNFFRLHTGDQDVIYADLPGYGFARTPKHERTSWNDLMLAYCARPQVAAYVFLMDARRRMDEEDRSVLSLLGRYGPIVIAVTKSDKAKAKELAQAKDHIFEIFAASGVAKPDLFLTSSLKKKGVEDLRQHLHALAKTRQEES